MADNIKIKAELDSKGVEKGAKKAKKSIKGLGRTIQTAMGFGLAKAIGMIARLMKNIIVQSVAMSAKFEDLRIIFRTMLGDAVQAMSTMSQLKEFSIKTPFTPEEVFKSSKALLAFGFAAKEQIGLIKMLGDVSAATGKPLEEMAFIYGKIFSRGKAQARELNQLIMAGVPIVGELAKVMKKPAMEIANLSKQGKIGFKDVEKAFKSMTSEGGKFYNLTETRSKSLSGRWSTLKGSAMDLGRAIGDAFAPGLLKVMAFITKLTDSLTAFTDGMRDMIKVVFDDVNETDALNSPLMGIVVSGDDIKHLKEFNAMLERQANAAEIKRAKKAKDRLDKEKAERLALLNLNSGEAGKKAAKNPFDKFFQQGIFMMNPTNMPELHIPQQQLIELIEIKRILANPSTERHAHIEAQRTMRSIKEGVMGGK